MSAPSVLVPAPRLAMAAEAAVKVSEAAEADYPGQQHTDVSFEASVV
jgi:hypothetical protein